MRRSRTATAALTGLFGLVAFFGLAGTADADINTQAGKSLSVASTGGTTGGTAGGTTGGMVIANPTPKPTLPDDAVFPAQPAGPTGPKGGFDISAAGGNVVIDPSGDPSDPCAPFASCPQDGVCTVGTVDPDCPTPDDDDDCVPSSTNIPNPDCPPPGGDCIPSTTNIPNPDCPPPGGDCVPSSTNIPNPDCPPPGGECIPSTTNIPNPDCPGDQNDCDDDNPVGRSRAADPCDPCEPERPSDGGPVILMRDGSECCPADSGRPDGTPRANATTGGTTGGTTSATTGGSTGGSDGRPTDRPEDCDGGGTDGTTSTGGSTGDSRLPKTGAELMTYAGAGLGLTGIGFGLKRLGRTTA